MIGPEPTYNLDFPYAHGGPVGRAQFRCVPEDFRVQEHLGFTPSGEGEHVWLHLRKKGENTHWLAQQIAQLAGVQLMDVGFSGRKDRHAVTSQWFSVYLPKQHATKQQYQQGTRQKYLDLTILIQPGHQGRRQ